MKKKSTALAILALIITLSIIALVMKQSPNSQPNQITDSNEHSQKTNFKSLVRASRQELVKDNKLKASSGSLASQDELKECTDYQDTLLSLDFNDFQYPPKTTTIRQIPKNCLTDDAEKLVESVSKKCAPFMNSQNPPLALSKEQWEKDFGDCKVALFFLRGSIVARQYENEKLENIKDVKVLSDLLLAEFSQAEDSGEAFVEIGKIAERMLELDPNIYFAAKVQLMSKIMEVLPLLGKTSEIDWSKVDAAIERALNYGQNDEELAELILFAKSQGFQKPDLLQGELSTIEKKFPGTGIGHYYKAYFSWKAGNREETISHLNDALRENPRDTRFQNTLAKVRDTNLKAGEGSPFIITLKLGLDTGDV